MWKELMKLCHGPHQSCKFKSQGLLKLGSLNVWQLLSGWNRLHIFKNFSHFSKFLTFFEQKLELLLWWRVFFHIKLQFTSEIFWLKKFNAEYVSKPTIKTELSLLRIHHFSKQECFDLELLFGSTCFINLHSSLNVAPMYKVSQRAGPDCSCPDSTLSVIG